jgi:hypothetical protein
MSELTIKPTFSLAPQNIEEALKFADYLAKSTIVPKDFANNPGNILVAIQWGMELGLQPMQAMQNIAVINGRPSLWGDAVLALVLSHPSCEDVIEYYEGEGEDRQAVCIAKRRGREDKKSTFSVTDAKLAGLLNKQGPWTQYRERMMKMRARSFCLRDQFADVLKGMPVAEEVQDIPTEREVGPAREAEPKALPAYPDAKLTENLPKWRGAIEANKQTPDTVIATISSKYTLTAEQAETIKQLKPLEGVTA